MDRQSVALSRAERQRLRDIERGLARDDPDFVTEFDDIDSSDVKVRRSHQRKIVGLIVLVVLGVGSIAAGLILALPVVGVAGFTTVVAAASRLCRDEQIVDRFRSVVGAGTTNPERPS